MIRSIFIICSASMRTFYLHSGLEMPFEVYLEDHCWTSDARHNDPRFGRVLMAGGRDASDVAITTSFGWRT
jgi:hypothetical protein